MRRTCLLMTLVLLGLPGSASAAPVATNITLALSIEGLAPVTIGAAGTISVSGSTITIAAGQVLLTSSIVVPVTSTTAVASITAMTVSNQAGTFSVDGVTAQAPGERCPSGGPTPGSACVSGSGLGGLMGLSGLINVHVVPNVVVIPVDLDTALLGQGGSTTVPFSIDAAAWTTRFAYVNTGADRITSRGGAIFGLTLVTPTFVSALGNLLPIFTSLTFTNTSYPMPEPGALVLIGSGALGLVLALVRR